MPILHKAQCNTFKLMANMYFNIVQYQVSIWSFDAWGCVVLAYTLVSMATTDSATEQFFIEFVFVLNRPAGSMTFETTSQTHHMTCRLFYVTSTWIIHEISNVNALNIVSSIKSSPLNSMKKTCNCFAFSCPSKPMMTSTSDDCVLLSWIHRGDTAMP